MMTTGRRFLALALAGCVSTVLGVGFDAPVGIQLAITSPGTSAKSAPPARDGQCAYLITVTNDFVVAAYKNGELIPDSSRELLLDRFGATAERINVPVARGDWLVFNVAHNPIRWGGSKYFAVAGCQAPNHFGFVSDVNSGHWSVCDDPAQVAAFIRQRNPGTKSPALPIANPWGEGDQYIREFAGPDFPGTPIWGSAPSTWIKFAIADDLHGTKAEAPLRADLKQAILPSALVEPKRWRVQILTAIYGTGGKNADVTEKVREHVETLRRRFSANPVDLGADPNPGWNKGLHIVYMKDGVRREQRRNENETILPESFYGPQDAGELRAWLPGSRWKGEQGEIQFHADGTFTSHGAEGSHRWEAREGKLRLTWSDQRTLDFSFDFVWSSFSEVDNGRNVYHVLK